MFCSNISWLHNYPGHVSLAHDDIYGHTNTRSAIVDLTGVPAQGGNLSCGQYSATCQNSTIFSQDFCSMKNVLASSTSAGDLIIHVGINMVGRRSATLKNDKVNTCVLWRSKKGIIQPCHNYFVLVDYEVTKILIRFII